MRQDLHYPAPELPPPSPMWSALTRRSATLSCVLALVACGGGGGGDDNQAEGPPPATGAALVAPAAQTLQLDHTATASTLQGSFAVQFQGNASPAWTAQSDQSWLVLNGASGSGAGAFAYAVDTSKLGDLPNWDSAVAHVRISANGVSVMTTLTLDKRLPEITMVSPNAVAAGQTGMVRVLGRGLSQLAGVRAIQVGSATGVTGNVVSDSEATLYLPALAQGRYAISVPSTLGVEGPAASLAAAAPSALAPTVIDDPREKASVVFDASRNAVYASTVLGSVYRWQLDGAQWRQSGIVLPAEDSTVARAGLLQMAPDRRTLYIATARNLVAVDPDTLAIQASYPLPTAWQGTYARFVRNLAITHDLRLWFAPYTSTTQNNTTTRTHLLAYFDLRTKRFETAQTFSDTPPALVIGGPPSLPLNADLVIGASGDGTRLLGIGAQTGAGNFIYNAAGASFTPIPALDTPGTLTAVSDDGKNAILDGSRFYGVGTDRLSQGDPLVGIGLPGAGGSALSSDRSRMYVLGSAASTGTALPDRILVYSVNTGFTIGFKSPIGTIDLPVASIACSAILPDMDPCTADGILTVSPLGDTLLWANHDRLIVLPIPSALRPTGASGG